MVRARSGFVCHAHRTLVSYELHHVWPLGYHGPNVRSNLVQICPNAHSDIHWLLERLLRGKPNDRREYGPHVWALAQRGYAAVTAYAEQLAATYR